MPLLTEIIAEATSRNGDVSRMLRLCLVLASKRRHQALLAWVRRELEGYAAGEPLPPYRILPARNRGQLIGPPPQRVLEIPTTLLPEKLQPFYERYPLRDGVGAYVSLLASGHQDGLRIPWSLALAVTFAGKILGQGQALDAWIEIVPADLAAMIDKIKTRALTFALDVGSEAANGLKIDAPHPNVGHPRKSPRRVTCCPGARPHPAAARARLAQAGTAMVQADDVDSLLDALRRAGVSETDLDNLQAALLKDRSTGKPGLGDAVKAWLGSLLIRARQGVTTVSTDVVCTTVVQGIRDYLGDLAKNSR
jgi:hypothetical protein